jgi:hypothetical protein
MTHLFYAITEADTVSLCYDKTGIEGNYLIAYNNIRGQSWELTNQNRGKIKLLYLDCGAYASSTGRCVISLQGYLRYLQLYGDKFDACFNLDDDFNNPAHNLRNQLYLERGLADTGILPVPVIHDEANPFAEFEMYAQMKHQYIAIGSAGSRSGKDQLLTQAKIKYPDVKIHLFGDLDKYLLEKHRPYSADSASWAHQAGKGGGICYWRPGENRQYNFNIGGRDSVKESDHIKLSPLWEEVRAFLYDKFRYEYNDLFKYQTRFILNLYSIKQYEDYLNSLDGK